MLQHSFPYHVQKQAPVPGRSGGDTNTLTMASVLIGPSPAKKQILWQASSENIYPCVTVLREKKNHPARATTRLQSRWCSESLSPTMPTAGVILASFRLNMTAEQWLESSRLFGSREAGGGCLIS